MSRVWIIEADDVIEQHEQIELEIQNGELINPWDKISK